MKNKKNKKKANMGTVMRNKFANAARGIKVVLKEESTLIFYLISIIIVVGLSIWLKINTVEWSILILTIGFVLGFEFVNTSIENLVDLLSFEYNIKAKKIKDIGAAASIINAIISFVIGFLILLPPFIEQINKYLS
ncbi:diacylglycerol kinase family protein [Spiroplasma alleghenense]|uniref:Undecaprenol kinase n=1 Tax=Spiroplasma alleghenense TaxID=216931 RepID=A0A345Z3C1_9MOLU|nr:diacylglycerol kinase family protein [Spiroplasma alleghenense]AXK51100.1 undecaprenol kinase [Spiroplasma alleghenense]